jgi:hypothetical protein
MKLRVLYCDDQQEFVDSFRDRHAEDFDVESLSNIADVYRAITERRPSELPDVLLLDLYHGRLDASDPELRAHQQLAKEKLNELGEKIAEVREYVDRAWSPLAIDVLEELRESYPQHKLPVMIYTQRGLLLLKDEEIRRIEEAHAEWLLKDPERISRETEAARIRRFVGTSKASRQMSRDIKLTIWSVIASAVIGAVIGVIITLAAS